MGKENEKLRFVNRFDEVTKIYRKQLEELDEDYVEAIVIDGARVFDVRQPYAMPGGFDKSWPDFRPPEEDCWEVYEETQAEIEEEYREFDVSENFTYEEWFYAICDGTFKDVIYEIPNIHVRIDGQLSREEIRSFVKRLSSRELDEVESTWINPVKYNDSIPLDELKESHLQEDIFASSDSWPAHRKFSRNISCKWPSQSLVTMIHSELTNKRNKQKRWLPPSVQEKINSKLDWEEYEDPARLYTLEITKNENANGSSLVFSIPPGKLIEKMNLSKKLLEELEKVVS